MEGREGTRRDFSQNIEIHDIVSVDKHHVWLGGEGGAWVPGSGPGPRARPGPRYV